MRTPSTNPITLRFGPQPGYPLHNGVHIGNDWAPVPDNKVYMTEDAIVTCVPNNGSDGNAIYYYKNNYKVAFCHLSNFLVPNGQLVKAGTPIGVIGYSGYVIPAGPLGAHLHMAIFQDGNYIDPLSMIDGGKGAEDMQYPNEGDLINIHNETGWPGHPINDNDKSYWCTGTGNPKWGNVNDVWVALAIEVGHHTATTPAGTILAPGTYVVK